MNNHLELLFHLDSPLKDKARLSANLTFVCTSPVAHTQQRINHYGANMFQRLFKEPRPQLTHINVTVIASSETFHKNGSATPLTLTSEATLPIIETRGYYGKAA
jgi:hypothetical protein